MKVLIYGSRGWIGGKFMEFFKSHNVNAVEGTARTDRTNDVKAELDRVAPTHVFCCVGRTHGSIDGKAYTTIDYLEFPGKLEENIRDNLFSPLSLALLCKSRGIHLSYMGTGCIFSYPDPSNPRAHVYSEEDTPDFFGSSYSTVKGFTDRLMHLLDDSVLNIRIRMPISYDLSPRNFLIKIINYEKINSNVNSMTVLEDFIPLLFDAMKNRKTGTINAANPNACAHNDILKLYKEIVDPSYTWKNFTYEEQMQILKSGRSNNVLESRKLLEWYPKTPETLDSVRKIFESWKAAGLNGKRKA
jgi:3,5-epimerase/4-reductase